MPRLRLLLCCDATRGGGAGHFFRCIALAEEALRRGWEVHLAGTIEEELARHTAEGLQLRVHAVDLSDAGAVGRLAREVAVDVVHLDSYRAPTTLLDTFRGTGMLLSSTEDGAWGRRAAHVVIDSSPGAQRALRGADATGELLLGAPYVPLRRSIRDSSGWAGRADPPRVLVMMGGTDARSVAVGITVRLAESLPGTELNVVSTGAAHGLPDGVRVHGASGDIVGLLAAHDVVVTAAGTTVWELCRLGVPMAVVRLVENQDENYRFLLGEQVAVGLGAIATDGDVSGLDFDGLVRLLHDAAAQDAMSARARELIDGRGVTRILDAWQDAAGRLTGLRLRAARAGDAGLLFAWRNDPATRAVSRTGGELDWSGHLAWLERRLASPDCLLLVAMLDGVPAGQVRFDLEAPGRWEISIVVDPALRGRGVGSDILDAAEQRLTEAAGPGPLEVTATVAASNRPSSRLFEAAGYRLVAQPASGGWMTLGKRVR